MEEGGGGRGAGKQEKKQECRTSSRAMDTYLQMAVNTKFHLKQPTRNRVFSYVSCHSHISPGQLHTPHSSLAHCSLWRGQIDRPLDQTGCSQWCSPGHLRKPH